jgi:hypothetical protein
MRQKSSLHWILLWILAVLITGAALIYQDLTGPTNPKRVELWLSDSQVYKFKLPRSHGGNTNCLIEISVPDTLITGDVFYRHYPTHEEWQKTTLVRIQDKLAAYLPYQPPAGKLEYYLLFRQEGKVIRMPAGEQVIIRFRGDVPARIIIPHASLMFIAMLLSNLTLLLALFNFRQYRVYGLITTIVLFIGGLILGPLVQKYAFGQYWTGFPFGFDLTDNKTLVAFIFWLLAIIGNLKKDRRYLIMLAALVMLVIFSIPHSAKGSELDPATGKIKTGMILVSTHASFVMLSLPAGRQALAKHLITTIKTLHSIQHDSSLDTRHSV